MAVYKGTHEGEGTLFVEVDLKKQLVPGTFEFTLYHLVNTLDISCFDTSYKNDKTGNTQDKRGEAREEEKAYEEQIERIKKNADWSLLLFLFVPIKSGI